MALMTRTNYPTLFDFLEDFWDSKNLPSNQMKMNMPAVNVSENNEEFKIDVAAPGFEKNDFNLNIENNVLTISSEKQFEEKKDEDNICRREYMYGSFQRSFSLPTTVDTENINAKYENGILKISIPKREEAKSKPPKRINIS